MTYQQQILLEEKPIGSYGRRWMEWMENNHKGKVRQMKKSGTYHDVARSVDKRAWDYKQLLDRQYEQMHPRPLEIEGLVNDELRAWKFTRDFYTDSAVMRDDVLMAVTAV